MPLNTTRPNAVGCGRDCWPRASGAARPRRAGAAARRGDDAFPVGWLFWLSFLGDDGSLSLEHYRRMIEQPSYARTFRATFEIERSHDRDLHRCSAIRWPMSCRSCRRRVANLCMIGVLLPFWTSLLVRTYAWLVLLQRRGLINTWGMELGLWDEPLALVHNLTGTVDRHGAHHAAVPRAARLRLHAGDRPRLPQGRGQSRGRAGPRVLAGVLSAVAAGPPGRRLIVFILCLGFYVTPAVLGGGKVIMVSNRIANDIEIFFNWGAASALGVVLLVADAAPACSCLAHAAPGENLVGRS